MYKYFIGLDLFTFKEMSCHINALKLYIHTQMSCNFPRKVYIVPLEDTKFSVNVWLGSDLD